MSIVSPVTSCVCPAARSGRPYRALPVLLVLVALLWGCAATRVENEPLEKYERGKGYGSEFKAVEHGDKLRVVLAFSGGGTRAAALSYGVLKALRDTTVTIEGEKVRLLDQVSTISSVSGGSFTAAYYGLNGNRIFDDYEKRFLRKNIDTRLAVGLLRPIKALRVWLTPYTRSDMAMDVYDKHVFEGATFEDLAKAKGPMLNINATDIDVGTVFTFIQPEFDMICSDLSKMKVVQAVTASSTVPGIFQPLLLKNNAGDCGHPQPEWIANALANPRESRRRYHEAKAAVTYLDSKKRPYIFLLDGGLADNIGARRIIRNVIDAGGALGLAKATDLKIPEKVLYIIVNAQASGKRDWDQRASLPSLGSVFNSVSGTGMYNYNFETIELLRESTDDWAKDASELGIPLEPHVVEVAFDNLADPEERKFFNEVKTSLSLDDETVTRLIDVGGKLLHDSSDFQDFMSGMQ